MKIPPDAIIPPEKLSAYLLRRREHDDKSGFLERLGFSIDAPGVLEAAIRLHASEGEAIMDGQDEYGDHFALIGRLAGPQGERSIKSIWVWRRDENALRFVTLYPVKEMR